MNKRILAFCVVAVLLLATGFMILRPKPKEVHYHAGFLVYVDGIQQDFSDSKYMKIEPCTVSGAKVHEDEELEKAHLHDSVGDVVHVHRTGAVWGDLFKNIHYMFKSGEPIRGFIGGKEIPNILTYPIKAYDSVIFVIGSDSGVDLTKVVTKAHIVEVENKGESCGK
jgi:hypothetical protein